MKQTLQPIRTDYSKRDNPNGYSDPKKYSGPTSPTKPKPLYQKKEELNKYAEKWETLPQAYEFVMANRDLLMNLSSEEAVDLYSRISFYSETTHSRKGISPEACEKLTKYLTTKHPELNKDAEESQARLDREAKYIVPELFKVGEYHDAYSRLGSRFKRSALEDKTYTPQITTSRNNFYGNSKGAKLKGIEAIAQEWATQ